MSGSSFTVRKTNLTSGIVRRSCAQASMPLSPGIEMSSTITSAWVLAARSMSARPSQVVPTISHRGSSKRRKANQKHRVVVGEEDAWAAIHWGGSVLAAASRVRESSSAAAIGTRTSTLVPLPACDSTESSPAHEPRPCSPILTRPSEPLVAHLCGSKPMPSSAMASRKLAALHC